jgi:hypothetical protein
MLTREVGSLKEQLAMADKRAQRAISKAKYALSVARLHPHPPAELCTSHVPNAPQPWSMNYSGVWPCVHWLRSTQYGQAHLATRMKP